MKGTPGCQIDSRIHIVSDYCFEKSKPSAFSNKNLVDFIKKNNFTHLEITGIDKAQCCAATAAEAISLGIKTSINNSATATTSPGKLIRVTKRLKSMGVEFIH